MFPARSVERKFFLTDSLLRNVCATKNIIFAVTMETENPAIDPHCRVTVEECRWIDLPVFPDPNGKLAVYDNGCLDAAFHAERVFFLYDVPSGASRGGHSEHTTTQLLIAVSGSFEVTVDDGMRRVAYRLDCPCRGLLIPPGIWRELDRFTSGAVCLVLASTRFNESDYVRDYDEFMALSAKKVP